MKAKPGTSLLISTLAPAGVYFVEGRAARITCPTCLRMVKVKRGLVEGHSAPGTTARCAGTAQHLTFDLTPHQFAQQRTARAEAWRVQRYQAAKTTAIDPEVRRQTAVHGVHYAPVVVPLHKMAALATRA